MASWQLRGSATETTNRTSDEHDLESTLARIELITSVGSFEGRPKYSSRPSLDASGEASELDEIVEQLVSFRE
jgi:hypothetical protein